VAVGSRVGADGGDVEGGGVGYGTGGQKLMPWGSSTFMTPSACDIGLQIGKIFCKSR
jgi:hypothetical protein